MTDDIVTPTFSHGPYSTISPKSNVSRASAMMAISMQQEKYNIKLQNIDIITKASNRKKLLLESYQHPPPSVFKNTRKVRLVQSRSPVAGEIDPSLISTLSTNLLNILNTSDDNNEILNEFNRHMSRVRISQEEPIHKYALEKARIIKHTYFTSDT